MRALIRVSEAPLHLWTLWNDWCMWYVHVCDMLYAVRWSDMLYAVRDRCEMWDVLSWNSDYIIVSCLGVVRVWFQFWGQSCMGMGEWNNTQLCHVIHTYIHTYSFPSTTCILTNSPCTHTLTHDVSGTSFPPKLRKSPSTHTLYITCTDYLGWHHICCHSNQYPISTIFIIYTCRSSNGMLQSTCN